MNQERIVIPWIAYVLAALRCFCNLLLDQCVSSNPWYPSAGPCGSRVLQELDPGESANSHHQYELMFREFQSKNASAERPHAANRALAPEHARKPPTAQHYEKPPRFATGPPIDHSNGLGSTAPVPFESGSHTGQPGYRDRRKTNSVFSARSSSYDSAFGRAYEPRSRPVINNHSNIYQFRMSREGVKRLRDHYLDRDSHRYGPKDDGGHAERESLRGPHPRLSDNIAMAPRQVVTSTFTNTTGAAFTGSAPSNPAKAGPIHRC